jgi:hypothetical protein
MRLRMTASALALTMTASLLALSACSSDEAAPEASASASALATDSPSPEATETIAATGAAAAACAAYFRLDLLNSAYAGGAVADGDYTEQQIRDEFRASLKELVTQAKAAVADGSATPKMVANAKRMKKTVNSLAKGQPLSDLSTAKQTRFAKSSLRVQKACDAAGYPLPADNVTARTAAGI